MWAAIAVHGATQFPLEKRKRRIEKKGLQTKELPNDRSSQRKRNPREVCNKNWKLKEINKTKKNLIVTFMKIILHPSSLYFAP